MVNYMNRFLTLSIPKYFLAILLLLIANISGAQYNLPENKTWVFGSNVKLDFNTGGPVYSYTPIKMGGSCTSPIIAVLYEASATVSDKSGQLLFSTDGSFVWNRTNVLMPNAQALHPYGATKNMTQYCTQGATIVPMPGDPDKYYVFSLTGSEVRDFYVRNTSVYCGAPNLDGGSLFYSIVDMKLNGGMGDVVPNKKWISLDTGLTEKAIVVAGERCNVWLLVHTRDSALFKAYEITRNGINPYPVISHVGSSGYVSNYYTNAFWTSGQLAISPNRRKLAAAYFEGGILETYDFDPNTGIISNPTLLYNGFANSQDPYGVAFSPDNSKLYAYISNLQVNTNGLGNIYQYNLSLPTTAAVIASQRSLTTSFASAQLKLAPDGKIYTPLCKTVPGPTGAGTFVRKYLSAINYPNLAGTACQYVAVADSFVAGTGFGITCNGLPNEVARAQPGGDTMYARIDTAICKPGDSLVFNAPIGYVDYLWDNGSTVKQRTIKQGGTYWVIGQDSCHTVIDSFIVEQMDTASVKSEIYLCLHDEGIVLYAPVGFKSYTWSDNSIDTVLYINVPGTYTVTAESGKYCSDRTDVFVVNRVNESFSLGNDTVICDGSSLLLQVSVPGASYLWQDGSISNIYNVVKSGYYTLSVDINGCKEVHTINVEIQNAYQDLGDDILQCVNEPLNIMLLANTVANDNITWSDGSHGTFLKIKDTGMYWVHVTGACDSKDTVHIQTVLCDCNLAIPSVFTPNGDGLNDIFRPLIHPGCPVQFFLLNIYNRFGQLVYSGTDPLHGWDGLQNGMFCDMGTYMYTFTFKGGTQGQEHTQKGDLTLIR